MIKLFKNFSYEIYHDFNELMINKWKEFEQKSNSTVFQKLFFVKNWDNTINKSRDYKLYVIFIYYNNSLITIMPLCIKRIFLFRVLQWIGEPFNDLNFAIFLKKLPVSDKELSKVIHNILNSNKEDYSIVYLEKQIENFNGQNNLFLYLNNKLTTEKNNSLNISEFLTYSLDNINFPKSIKYKKRCLANIKKFNITYKSSLMNEIDLNFKEKVYSFFLKNKSARIEKSGAWNYLKFKKYVDFINLNLNSHKCVCNAIYIDNEIVSANIGFIDNKVFYYIFPSYDLKWHKISPGLINLYLNIKEIFDNEICHKFDYTIGNESYKDIWSNKTEFLFQSFLITSFKGHFLMPFLYYRGKHLNTTLFKILKYFYKKLKK